MRPDHETAETFELLRPVWESIISDFVSRDRKERFLFLAGSRKRQITLCRELLHVASDFEPESILPLPRSCTLQTVAASLRQHGAAEPCWTMSIMPHVHGRQLSADDALKEVFNTSKESLLYFPSAHVAYYEGAHDERAVLVRKK